MKRYQVSLFDAELPNLEKSAVLKLEWDELDYRSRCCLSDMAGFRGTFVEETLAKQQAIEVDKWVKCMLYWNLHDRSKGKVELRFNGKGFE